MDSQTDASYKIFGDFIEELPTSIEYLTLSFSPTYAPLKKRWENNGLSADFIADYFKVFYISKQEELDELAEEFIIDNLRDSVKYVANELLENAMKFQDSTLSFKQNTASIILSLHSDKIIFSVSNYATEQQAVTFQRYIEHLLAHDPNELYVETMRNSAKAENARSSGLGILSMICDYSASLGWKFQTQTTMTPPVVTITTMVTLHAQQP